MKKFVFIILVLCASVYLTSCGKKQATLEQMQEPLSMEALSALDTTAKEAPESKTQVAQAIPQAQLEPLPPSGPYKPTAHQIQTALKNAGYYTGNIDGKIGPLTRKAIEEFQQANTLSVDGKVGPKTWSVLSTYLNPPVEFKSKKKQ